MLIVVESPFRETAIRTRAQHTEWARELCRALSRAGHEPFASHLLGPQFLDEDVPADREAGIRIQLAVIRGCAAVWVWDVWGITNGMKAAIKFAEECNAVCRARGLPPIQIMYASRGECPAWADLMEVKS
jgi:hypothetical protein